MLSIRTLTSGKISQMAKSYKVGIIAGDGIGKEVIPEGLKVAAASGVALDTVEYDLGGERYLKDEVVLPDSILDEWRGLDALYLGAVGTPEVPPGIIERGLLLKMRFELDMYINLRPFVSDGLDFEVVRENTEGSYAGEGGFLRKNTPDEIATQGSVNTKKGVERCVRYAFERVSNREMKKLTLVHKTNVLTFAGDLWERTFNEVASQYPKIETNYQHIDAACIHFVESPQQYSVIVTDNLFGDILTDLGGAISGGIGTAASANLNPDRTGPSMFEPVHGSAPDIAGKGVANPLAAILSLAMMFDFLGEDKAFQKIVAACRACEKEMPAENAPKTSEIGDFVASKIS